MQTPALLRARWWAIANAWRFASPPRKLWLAFPAMLGILVPLSLRASSAELSMRVLQAFASFDALPALLITAWIILELLPRLARLQREDAAEWVVPRVYRPRWRLLTMAAAIAAVLKVPALLAVAVTVLSYANEPAATLLRELMVSLVVAGVAGISVSLLLADSRGNRQRGYPVLGRVNSGKALLALLPLAVFSEFINLRRILWLAVPVMLKAEVGASVNSVVSDALPWLLGVACLLLVDSLRLSLLRLRAWVPAVLLPTVRVVLPSAMVVSGALMLMVALLELITGRI